MNVPESENDQELEAMLSETFGPPPVVDIGAWRQRYPAALALLNPQRFRAQSQRRKHLQRLVLSAAAAAAAMGVWLGLAHLNTSWAQVQTALQSKPWVRLTTKDVPAESNQWREIWLSYPRDVSALHVGGPDRGMIRYTDLRLGIRTQYDPASKELIRVPVDDNDSDATQSIMTLLNSIFRGQEPRGERFDGQRIVGRKQRSVEEGGRKWLEYEIQLERGDPGKKSFLTIRVDPETNLPATMTLAAAEGGLEFAFDYPAEGPADIYALGVPRDTPLDDRMPGDDLKRVLSALSVGNRELDNYFAAIGRDGRVELLAWRRGDKWRLARCTPPPDPDKVPKDEAQLSAWWRKHLEEVPPVPTFVCDGQRVWSCETEVQPDGSKQLTWSVERTLPLGAGAGHRAGNRNVGGIDPPLIELAAYPMMAPGPRVKLSLDPTGAGGPAGSVMLELSIGSADGASYNQSRELRWLDPQRGYAVVKDDTTKGEWYEYDDFRQSPRGIWYPTRAVRKRAMGQKAAEQAIRERAIHKQAVPRGKIEQDDADPTVWHEETETRYFLDFSAELPDELFKPQ